MSVKTENIYNIDQLRDNKREITDWDAFDKYDDKEENTLEMESSSSEEEETGEGFSNETRNNCRTDIWESCEILESLQTLPDFEEINELLKLSKTEAIVNHTNGITTGLLLASWLGNHVVLKELLKYGRYVETKDCDGRTPLHLSAYAGHVDCLRHLIDASVKLSEFDGAHSMTPLHCAASKGNLACVKLLLYHGADVNAGVSVRSALHLAVQCQAVDCVKELLEHGAIPNTPQVYSETPLHVAAELGSTLLIQLLLAHGACVQVQSGQDRATPLHLTVADGNADCTRLLLDAGADISAANHKGQTPLHLAALGQAASTLELLLSRGADPNVGDTDGRTPLHGAIVKVSRSCDCMRLLIGAGANVNQADFFGYTPLHLAALNEFSQCVLLLINHGGDVTARTNGGVSVLTFITRRTPDIVPKYMRKFDTAIQLTDHELGDVDCELKLDFRVLVPTVRTKRETELILNFIEVGHREVLKHPLCETFLFLKWRRIRKFFLFSLFYHALYVFLYTSYVMGVFLRDCPSMRRAGLGRMGPVDNCTIAPHVKFIGYAIIILNFLLMGKELFQIAHGFLQYTRQWENWLQWFNIVSVFCCVYPSSNDIRNNMYSWQHHVAAVGIFLAWLELEMIVGRFPIFGLYVQMFTTVAVNFAKFFLAYACLLIAFALSFGILFANYKAFKDTRWAIMKTIIMMSGELEFEDLFYGDDTRIVYPITAHIMYLAFVVLVTIILTNLMVGLAVSDIQGLLQSAGLDRLVRQAELVAHLESMLFSRLLKFLPDKFLGELHRQALLLKSEYHWALYIKPNDPRESRIPKDLIQNIYGLVAARKARAKKNCSDKYKFRQAQENGLFSRLNSRSEVKNDSEDGCIRSNEIHSDEFGLYDVKYANT